MERLVLVTENRSKTDLLSRCRDGDREAIRTLYMENQKRVYSIALNFFGGDQERASDVTQQVFLKLLKKVDFRGDSEFTTWIYRITVNQCIDDSRKSKRYLNFEDWFGFAEPVTRMSLTDKLHSREISAEVQAVVASLKPKYRLPILLKYVEGMSYQEIAGVLRCSIGTVSSRLNRGHKLLATKLEHLRNEV
jgi:RNA polymerase sigma-70 factor (ECF subfamily)